MKTGIELIQEERQKQITEKGYDAKHDAEHSDGSLALAAACYAAPKDIYELRLSTNKTILFEDPYPFGQEVFNRGEPGWHQCSTREKKVTKTRIEQLAIAGALIVAEIDRLGQLDKEDGRAIKTVSE